MKRSLIAACAGLFALSWGAALAEEAVGEQPPAEMALCALRDAALCTPGGSCAMIPPGGADPLPDFLWIDFVDQRAWTSLSGPQDTTEIFGVHHDGNAVMLYGAQDGMAWAMAIDAQTGAMALAGVGPDGVRNVFAACTRVARSTDGQ